LEGELVGGIPEAKRLARGISATERIAKVEKKLDRIYRILAPQKVPVLTKPKTPAPPQLKGKKKLKRKGHRINNLPVVPF
jgi:hypothetical protein